MKYKPTFAEGQGLRRHSDGADVLSFVNFKEGEKKVRSKSLLTSLLHSIN